MRRGRFEVEYHRQEGDEDEEGVGHEFFEGTPQGVSISSNKDKSPRGALRFGNKKSEDKKPLKEISPDDDNDSDDELLQ